MLVIQHLYFPHRLSFETVRFQLIKIVNSMRYGRDNLDVWINVLSLSYRASISRPEAMSIIESQMLNIRQTKKALWPLLIHNDLLNVYTNAKIIE